MKRSTWVSLWVGVTVGAIVASRCLLWLFDGGRRSTIGTVPLVITLIVAGTIAGLCYVTVRRVPQPTPSKERTVPAAQTGVPLPQALPPALPKQSGSPDAFFAPPEAVSAAERAGELTKSAAFLATNGLHGEVHVLIPRGRSRQVTREQEHLSALRPYLAAGGAASIAAILKSETQVGPRSTKEVVTVLIGGRRIGVLSDLQGGRFLPLVKFIEQRGLIPVVEAAVSGTEDNPAVVFWAEDSTETDSGWLNALAVSTNPPAV